MSTTRVQDWRPRLVAWAEEVRGLPFVWGRTDCGTLTRKALAVCFGRDIFSNVPHWRNVDQAATVLARYGTMSYALEQLGAQEVELPFARAGDVTVVPEAEEPLSGTALGVWIDGFAVMSGRAGVGWIDRESLALLKPRLYSLWEIPDLGTGPYG